MLNITRDSTMRLYDLGIIESDLFIHIESKVADFISEKLKRTLPIMLFIQEKLSLPEFIEPAEKIWGFGGSAIITEEKEGHIVYRCPLPIIIKQEEDADSDWKSAYSLSATLRMIFALISIFDEKVSSEMNQLLSIEMEVKRGQWGGVLWARISPQLCQWLSTQKDHSYPESIILPMRYAFHHMNQKASKIDDYRLKALCRQPKWINISCPGDACGLDPDSYNYLGLDRGYRLCPHNTDNPLQQLTLLSGLAALYQSARENGF